MSRVRLTLRRVSWVSFADEPREESPQPPSRPQAVQTEERRAPHTLRRTIVVLAALLLGWLLFAGLYTDWLWYAGLDKTKVFSTSLVARLILFVVFGVLMAASLIATMVVAYRGRPIVAPVGGEQSGLERYRSQLAPLRKPLMFGVAAAIGLLSGLSASAQWETWMLWRNAQPFGRTDPQFGEDVGFYVFEYPFLRMALGFAFSVVIFSLIAAVVVQYLYGGLRLQGAPPRVSRSAQVQLSILGGVFCLLKAVGYYLDRYGLAVKSESLVQGFTGLRYRDVNAVLPAKQILMLIAIICAVLFFANIFRRTSGLALIGLGLLAVSALIIGGIYPAIVQQFQVKPSELLREQEYIARNIAATRDSFDIVDSEVTEYAAKDDPNAVSIEKDAGTLSNVRLLDPALLSPTYRALQQIRSFYSFPDSLDVDRYALDGRVRGAVVSAREVNLEGIPESQRNWANDTFVYTHGYGFVAAYDNEATAGGAPKFFEYDIPDRGLLEISQPRLYFGESSPEYSIVGAPAGEPPRELDYPDDGSPNGQANNTYDGTGGVPMGSFFRRMLFATKYAEPNILLSDLVNSDSRIMWDRDPRQRVERVAPWLTVDGDPYSVVVGGRIKWIVDGYTTTSAYPYATRVNYSDATSDSVTVRAQNVVAGPQNRINYMRNSVKAVVDGYDGTVDLYAWDESDPLLKAWSNAFPGTVRAKSEMDPEVLAHVRYPEDIFKVQRLILSRYHVTDPAAFYSGQDFWIVPTDPTTGEGNLYQPPYYLQVQMPGQAKARFSLTTTFAPAKRPTLAAFMAVSSDPASDYGKLQVLQLPRNTTIPGPSQVQNIFESDPDVAAQLSLLRRGGSDVELGNLLSLPVGGGLLYVEPVYVRAAQDGYPLLRKVLVSFGNEVAFENTLAEGLTKVFGTDGGARPADKGNANQPKLTAEQQLTKALAEANAAYADGQAALAKGDFAAYGKAQARLEAAIKKAEAASRELSK